MFVRPMVFDASMIARPARPGDGVNNPLIVTQATDSNQTLTVAAMAGGVYQRAGMTAGRSDTTDTAANIIAAFPNMDIGDSMVLVISVSVAFTLTLLAGAGVTLAGATTVIANSMRLFLVTKTGAATVTITGL